MADILIKIDNDRVKKWGHLLICMCGSGCAEVYPTGFEIEYDEKVKQEPVIDIKIDGQNCILSTDGLLPCPLCGSQYIQKTTNVDSANLHCQDCGCIVVKPTMDEAIQRWNTRNA